MTKEAQRSREYYLKNTEKRRADSRRRYKANPEYAKQWAKDNKEKCLLAKRKYDTKMRRDPTHKVIFAVRAAMYRCIKGAREQSWTKIVGYGIDELRVHLEKQFDLNMSWDNYGSYWHIDHIRPIKGFNLKDRAELKKCWELNNLRPLEASYNIKKRDMFEVSHNNFVKFVSFKCQN